METHTLTAERLHALAEQGFDWVWFLSVWQTGAAGQQVSRSKQEWRQAFAATLPNLRDEDIAGSGFAITGYTVHQALGGAWECFLAFAWHGPGAERLGDATYDWQGSDLHARGLYLDEPPWQAAVFALTRREA